MHESTCSGSIDKNILDQHNESITLNDIIRLKLIRYIWQGKLIKITYSDMEEDEKYLKI